MHRQFLLAALDQARLMRGFCAPNPSVGAVAVQNGKIIAHACHHGAGTPHAEQLLLEQLPPNVSNLSLYVTLEPCNHWGRTPPCVNAIARYGVKRVVYGYSDPNPLVAANNTPRLLAKAGVEVIHSPLDEIDEFYRSYRHWTLTGYPWITVKIAQTLDGKIAGQYGERVYLSNDQCSDFTHKNRSQSDLILTTARTVNRDDPQLNVRINDAIIDKPVAIIDRNCELNPNATIFKTAKHCHVFCDEQLQKTVCFSNSTCYGIKTIDGRMDLSAVFKRLGKLGYHDVWVEAGGQFFYALHQANLVQKTYIYLVPKVLGPSATSGYPYEQRLKQAKKVVWIPAHDNLIISLEWDDKESMCLRA